MLVVPQLLTIVHAVPSTRIRLCSDKENGWSRSFAKWVWPKYIYLMYIACAFGPRTHLTFVYLVYLPTSHRLLLLLFLALPCLETSNIEGLIFVRCRLLM
ncbi:hypothetical protein J3E72DRAFT_301730, partial [Bipolaris maydis]